MEQTLELDNFIGNGRIVEVLKRAIEQDRLPHAMIFAGPDGIGKCTLALLIAQLLNCLSPENQKACGQCASCRKIGATMKSRNLRCLTSKDEDCCGVCANCRILMQRHPDVRIVEPEKSVIKIEQTRGVIDDIAFQPYEARYRMVILDPADRMNVPAQNSLLKTLEEPSSRTIIVLITPNPYMLLETIRSRARLLQFGEIPRDAIARHLMSAGSMSEENAHLAAALSGGSLASALAFDTQAYGETREQALRFVSLLLKGNSFTEASLLAGQLPKDKRAFPVWIDALTALLEDIYYAQNAPDRIGQKDLLHRLEEIARTTPRTTLAAAIGAVGKLKRDLQINVNRPLAVEAMYLSVAGK